MRLSDLTEKLVRFEIVDPGKGTAFDDVDTRLINTPSYSSRLQKAFGKTPFPFEIYIVHHPHDHSHWIERQSTYTNVMDAAKIKANYWPEFKHNPSAITLFITNNFADNKHPLTPWIIAHRFVHVIDSAANAGNRKSRWTSACDNFAEDIARTYQKFGYAWYGIDNHEAWYEIVAAMTTKSARTPASIDRLHDGEASHELMTQFIINGRVSLNTDYIEIKGPDYYEPAFGEAIRATIKRNEQKLNREAANDLSRAIGQIFVI
jgi:hypothetical protein